MWTDVQQVTYTTQPTPDATELVPLVVQRLARAQTSAQVLPNA